MMLKPVPEDGQCFSIQIRDKEFFVVCACMCQINVNLVFHISEDGSEIEVKHVLETMLGRN